MNEFADLTASSFQCVHVSDHHIVGLNSHSVTCQLRLSKAGGKAGKELKCARGESGQGPFHLPGAGSQLGGWWGLAAKPSPASGRSGLACEDLLGDGG